MELLKNKNDVWNGKLMGPNTPLSCEIVRGKEVLINLDDVKLD